MPRLPGKGIIPSKAEQKLINDAIYGRAFKGLTRKQSDEVRKEIVRGIRDKEGIQEVIKRITASGNVPVAQANLIVRTEDHEIRAILREAAFKINDPKGENLYKWAGPSYQPGRSTKVCQEIKRLTRNGVTMQRLKEIVREQAHKYNPKWEVRDWTPHGNCRHQPIRYFGD
ncbi:MAG: hypothetical protein WC350_05580 [Candidatus Micrarchaeia archaeon]|jgi:hypothetical protein